MIRFVALMVVYDLQTSGIVYISREMYREQLPLNNSEDIIEMVSACNSNNADKHLQYIDMYGYVMDGYDTLWEEYDDAEEDLIEEKAG